MHHSLFSIQLPPSWICWPLLWILMPFWMYFIHAVNYRSDGKYSNSHPVKGFPWRYPFFFVFLMHFFCTAGCGIVFKMESDRAAPFILDVCPGMRQVALYRFEVGLSQRDRCCTEEESRYTTKERVREFFFGDWAKMKGPLSSSDTKLIVFLYLVTEHSVPRLTSVSF